MTIYQVSTAAGLLTALESAQGNDEIQVASGNYGDVSLSGFTFSSEVTIISADKDNPAVFNSMRIGGAENITLDGLSFDFVPDETTKEFESSLLVSKSAHITVRNSVFEGGPSVAGVPIDAKPGEQGAAGILGLPIARGITVNWSDDITLENNDISEFTRGIILNDVDGAVIRQNEIHDLRTSPLGGAQLNDIIVEENYFHSSHPWNFGGAGNHGDYIHFWTAPKQDGPSDNIVIRNNFLAEGDGDSLLGIYLDDNANKKGFTNVQIEGNVIHTGNAQAIRLEDVVGGTVYNNTLIQSSGDANDAPRIRLEDGVKNVVVRDNIGSGEISGDAMEDPAGANITLSGNLLVQYTNPEGANYFGDLFINSSIPGASLSDLRVVPGSAADGIGSPLTLLDETPKVMTPGFQVTAANGDDGLTLVMDASYTYGRTGQVMPEDATFVWDFGDGRTGEGQVVQHHYDTAGNYDVTLKVLLNGKDVSKTKVAQAEVGIAGEDILSFNATDGHFYLQGYGQETIVDDSDTASVVARGAQAIDLGASGTQVEIPKTALSRFFGTDEFEMSMTLQADQPGISAGEVVRIHSSIIVTVMGDGDLNVQLFSDSGERIHLTAEDLAVNDGQAHDISIRLDGASDSLQILIDGTVAASETVTGSMPLMGSWGLVFGEPGGKQNFDGKLSAFELAASSTDYPTFDGILEADLPVLDDFVSDFEHLTSSQLRGDAYVEISENGDIVHLDGEKDYAHIGKLDQFEDTDQLSFSVTYSKEAQSDDLQRIVWKSRDIGLAVEGDSLKLYVGQDDARFRKAITIEDLGLDDTETHQVTVLVDATTDHLQVILDGAVVLDRYQDIDIALDNGFERAWKVGGARKDTLDGEINDFRIDATAEFVPEDFLVQDDASLMA